MSQPVSYHFENGISTITLDDGKVNALSVAMQADINAALDKAEADGGIVVIVGNQKMFSAGFDLKVFQTGGDELKQMLIGGFMLSQRLMTFPTPVIAACTGHAMAMGFFLLLSCDYRVGVNTEVKLCANEVAIGLTLPYSAVEVCRQKLAPTVFCRVTNLAESFWGESAVAAGILDKAVSLEQVLISAQEKARQFKELNLAAYKATKARTKADTFTALQVAMEKDTAGWQIR